MNAAALQELVDRLQITNVVNNVAICADLHNWQGLAACFAETITVDYTSLLGGTPIQTTPAELIARWRATLSGFQATHHMITNQRIHVQGDTATCVAYVQATHYLPNPDEDPWWILGGIYTYQLARTPQGWRVTSPTLTVAWERGNRHLMALAQARASDQH